MRLTALEQVFLEYGRLSVHHGSTQARLADQAVPRFAFARDNDDRLSICVLGQAFERQPDSSDTYGDVVS